MSSFIHFFKRFPCLLVLTCFVMWVSCEPPIKQPTGPAKDYSDAEDLFKKGDLDRTLQFTEGLASASPATSYTDRARVLRIIVFGGRIQAYQELANAYGKGAELTKKTNFKANYERLRNDALQNAADAAMGMAEAAHQMMSGPGIGKEVVLEAPYPSAEGPTAVTQLERVKEGEWIDPGDQEAAAQDAQHKGIDDELGAAVGGDRAKARQELGAGPVKIVGVDFALFLGKELLNAAGVFDSKHYNDIDKFKIIIEQADGAAQAALAILKVSPDNDKEKATKKLQDDIKETVKKDTAGFNAIVR